MALLPYGGRICWPCSWAVGGWFPATATAAAVVFVDGLEILRHQVDINSGEGALAAVISIRASIILDGMLVEAMRTSIGRNEGKYKILGLV